jgi:hypothetical protein
MTPMQLHRTPEGKRQKQEWKPYILQKKWKITMFRENEEMN